ncbi:hypothetical protein diail_6789 [Diaporthe ilicicola]|nr:hypothetical protein diail_6789 [Diaporthe ilicicola]
MLDLLKQRNVWGVIRLDAHYVGVNTEMLHNGLTLDNPITLHTESEGARFENDGTVRESASQYGEYESKIFTCTVAAPEGRVLHKCESVLEVLYALRDAAKAHRSLYQDGRILHRDINPSNISIPSYGPNRDAAADTVRGVLIDFDLAKETSDPHHPKQAVGTYIFQAIGVLQAHLADTPHTYRHDLESLFYTFLFLAVAPRPIPKGEDQLQLPASSVLREWNKGRLSDRANRKVQDGLGVLAETLRAILFPVGEDGEIWTETDMTQSGTNALYDAVIG